MIYGRSDIYMHPDLLNQRNVRRYRRSDDVYSLGIILFEIANWETADSYSKIGMDAPVGAKRILHAAEEGLAVDVGEIYQQAVVICLKGLRSAVSGDQRACAKSGVDEYDGVYRGEDPEYGLESDLLWHVVRQFEKLRV